MVKFRRAFSTKLFCLFILVLCINCKSKKKTVAAANRTVQVAGSNESTDSISVNILPENEKVENIIATALTYSGVKYKFGGTTKRGMDCSGLIYVSLLKNDIPFPRVSYQMATQGHDIKLKKVQSGDLLFFKTRKRGKRINHVGLVVDVDDGDIKFIHSTTSRGVIVSSLREGYWNSSFVKATRIL